MIKNSGEGDKEVYFLKACNKFLFLKKFLGLIVKKISGCIKKSFSKKQKLPYLSTFTI